MSENLLPTWPIFLPYDLIIYIVTYNYMNLNKCYLEHIFVSFFVVVDIHNCTKHSEKLIQ